MPEYLAPDVYVEEIDTGSKPIEGVSTSTAGMVGVTERGPVDVPILVTSYGEYMRWFGEGLNKADFLDHCYLPHAVQGFFTNGGKRLYVVRVLDTNQADNAATKLFDRNTAASATTQLLTSAASGATQIYVVNNAGLGVSAPPTWIQIGDGSGSEYRTIINPAVAPSHVALRMPLTFAYSKAANVDHFAPFVAPGTSVNLAADAKPGDMTVRVGPSVDIAQDSVLQLGATATGDDEYLIAATDVPAAGTDHDVPLRAPVMLSHAALANLVGLHDKLAAVVAAPDRTNPTVVSAAGGSVLLLADRSQFLTVGDVVRVSEGTHVEIRRIGAFGALPLAVGAYGNYPTGSVIESVTLADDATGDKSLKAGADAAPGTNVLELTDRDGLVEGRVLRIGAMSDGQREFIGIKKLPNPQPSPNPGKVILATPLQHGVTAPSEIQQIADPILRAAPGPTGIAADAPKGSGELIVPGSNGYAMNNLIRATLPSGEIYYHRLPANPTALSAGPLTLNSALTLPHAASEALVARTPLMSVVALDAGRWGNRLRVAVQDNDPPLAKTKIRTILDWTHIRLESSNGVEPGTILNRVDATGAVLESVKVQSLDRQNDFLVTLDAALPLSGGAAVGDAIRSQEFQFDVFLMRQPDLAVPTRADSVLTSESFPYLSLDPRHSRYIHKVIGTTWAVGAAADDDGNPLRRSDERSEGTSWLVRVRDEETDPAGRLLVRLGPEPLTDALPSGAERPARLRLFSGDDAVGGLTDAIYLGQPNIEPALRTGLHCLENKEDISIVACPGRTGASLQGALIEHCENMRYRFAVLDGPQPPNDSLNDAQAQRQQFDTKYAAFYHPWLIVPEPFPTNLAKIADYPIPPSGHMVGIYARTDIERGVHKAPANEGVRGITGLQRLLNKSEHDILNPYPVNINVIRDFRNNSRGIRVYGGRVITSDPDWKYVNVRRLLIFIEASINRGLQWVVFEPNAEPLWARVRRSITNFLTLVWRNGALEGTNVEEAFFVKCDRTTMTQTDIDSGRLICVVGVAPVKPAEFVIVRIGLWTAHADD
jgi:Bacteriophage tail sheath protein